MSHNNCFLTILFLEKLIDHTPALTIPLPPKKRKENNSYKQVLKSNSWFTFQNDLPSCRAHISEYFKSSKKRNK